MALTAQQLAAREGRLTASRVACLMTGDQAKIMNLWMEMVGDPGYMPEDLSGVWPIALGTATESTNLDWYERKTGRILTRRGEVAIHPVESWAACTLDGYDAAVSTPVEAKHVGGREPLGRIIDRYQPQCQWTMIVTGTMQVILSVIEGANEPILETIPVDPGYAGELWQRAAAFMDCVRTLTPPFSVPPVAPPIRAEVVYDMSASNSWADNAAAWREHYSAKKRAETAEKALKSLVPEDAAKCHGHQVVITRSRAGYLSLREAS